MGFSKILWAIDPFDQNIKGINIVKATLKALKPDIVQPIFILSPKEFHHFRDFNKTQIKKNAPLLPENIVKDRILRYLKDFKNVCPPVVLSEVTDSSRVKAQRLVRYAEENGFEIIAANTHAKTGLQKLFMGSFAEALLLLGFDRYLFTVPSARAPKALRHILYPTDFSAHSKSGFQSVLDFCKLWNAKLSIIFAQSNVQIKNYSVVAEGKFLPYLMLHDDDAVKKSAEEFMHLARSQGVRADIVIKKSSNSTESVILSHAKKIKSDLIIIQARKSGILENIFGSTVRSVIRGAQCPVIAIK